MTTRERNDQTANLESRALAVDLIHQGRDAIMDCDTERVWPLVVDACRDMNGPELRVLIHQMAWIAGTLATLVPDAQRRATLAGFVATDGDAK